MTAKSRMNSCDAVMAKRCPSRPISVAVVDPHLLCFTSPGVEHAADRRPDGEHWLMSFVSSEMESAATELFPALSHRGATVQRHVCETCADDVCEAESAFSVCLQSLVSAAVCSLVSAGIYLTISKKKKKMAGASVNQSSHCPIWSR